MIEFTAAAATQRTPYAAEIEFFDSSICMRAIEVKLQLYFARLQKERDGEEPSDEEIADTNTAIDFFVVLFRNHDEFSDQDSAEEFLATALSLRDSAILTKLRRWTTELLTKFAPSGNSLILGANTIEDLTDQYLPFTTRVDDAIYGGAPLDYSPWPFVRIVRVLMHHAILDQGITIADLPGLTDYNKIRVKATSRYLRSCDYTICVGRIDRVETSNTFTKYYTDAFRRRRHGSVIFVITRTDDMRAGHKSNIPLDAQGEEISSMISKQVSSLEKMRDANRTEIKRMKGNRAAVNQLSLTKNRIAQVARLELNA